MNISGNIDSPASSKQQEYIQCSVCLHRKLIKEELYQIVQNYSFDEVRKKLRCQVCGSVGKVRITRARVQKNDLISILKNYKDGEIKSENLVRLIGELASEGNYYAEEYLKDSKLIASLEKKSREYIEKLLKERPARYRTKRWYDEDTGLTNSNRKNGKGMFFTPGKRT